MLGLVVIAYFLGLQVAQGCQHGQSLAGGCSQLNCGPGKKCIVNRLHKASCVADPADPADNTEPPQPPEHTGPTSCDDFPPNKDNALVTIIGHDVGDTATYDCIPGFMMCGAHTVECQATGIWSASDFRCLSDYVSVNEWKSSVCSLTRGSSVVLTDITPAMEVVTIDIYSNATKDKHPRLEMFFGIGRALWSIGGGANWSTLVEYNIRVEPLITLNITLTVDRIEVHSNGDRHSEEHIGTFEESYRIDINSTKDTDEIRVRNCCLPK